MHYYKKNIGDYHKKAGRLSMLQHGAYTLLLDSCYDREIFPTLEQAIEWSWAGSKEEIEAVEFVLKRFFSLEDGLYVQKRIQVELDKFHETSKTNKRIAQERETKRKKKSTKRAPIVDEPPQACTNRRRTSTSADFNFINSSIAIHACIIWLPSYSPDFRLSFNDLSSSFNMIFAHSLARKLQHPHQFQDGNYKTHHQEQRFPSQPA